MIPRKRLALQLTPLLDLMLIVMFSQHLEYRQITAERQQQIEQQTEQLAQQQQQLAQQQQQLNDQRSSLARQYLSTAELLATLLSPTQQNELSQQLQNFPEVRNALQQQLSYSPDGAARFLTQASAMQKHVSIWEIHLLDSGRAEIRCDGLTESTDFDTPGEFADRLFLAAKRFPTPHSLVLVLLSWGDTQLGPRQAAEKGLPLLLEQLRRDASGIRWYDFAIPGYRPLAPPLPR